MPLRSLLHAYRWYVALVFVVLLMALAGSGAVQAREIEGVYADEPRVAGSGRSVAIVADPGSGRYAALQESIEATLADLNGEWGIGVLDLSTGDTLLMNAERPYQAASQYKLVVFYEAYRQIETGALELDQMTSMIDADYSDSIMWDEELKPGDRVSVKGLLRVMVIQSSNAAAHAIERLMGISVSDGKINEAAQRMGLSETRMPTAADRGRFDDWRAESASTSVGDLMSFYQQLYRGTLLSEQSSKAMLDLLKEQQINDRIPALLPSGVEVAHKTGNLPGVVNDAGIIFGPRKDVILVVLNDGADYEPATAAIGEIGKLVYNFHNR